MPRRYIEIYDPTFGGATRLSQDLTCGPINGGVFDQISFDDGNTWSSFSDALAESENDTNQQGITVKFKNGFSVRRINTTTSEAWFGFSLGKLFPLRQNGHSYLAIASVRNSGAAVSSVRLRYHTAATGGTVVEVTASGTANQTNYTRLALHIPDTYAEIGRFYIDTFASTAGSTIQLDIKSWRQFDVTGWTSAQVSALSNLSDDAINEWCAIRTDLSAVAMTTLPGITQNGNYLMLDVANSLDIANGELYKAVTANKLKQMIESGEDYKVYDNNGKEVYLVNLAETYTSESMISSSLSTNAKDAVWNGIRSVWGTCNRASYGGRYFSQSIVRNNWIKSDPTGRKYIMMYDLRNETQKAGTYAAFGLGASAGSTDIGIASHAFTFNKWIHCALLITASGEFSIDFRIYNLEVGDQFRASFKNFKLYDVTDIPISYYNRIGMNTAPLFQGEYPVQVTGKTVSFAKATLSDLIDGTDTKNSVVDADVLNSAINLGKAIDVTSGPLYFTGFTHISFDDGATWTALSDTVLSNLQKSNVWRGAFSLRSTSAGTSLHAIGWNTVNDSTAKLFPKRQSNRKYLNLMNVSVNTAASMHYLQGTLIPGVDNAFSDSTETEDPVSRVAVTFNENGISYIILYPSSSGTVRMDIYSWRQYDVTDLSNDDIVQLVKQTYINLDDAYYKYFLKEEAINPFTSAIDVTGTTVQMQPGRYYRLSASSGTYTLSVGSILENTRQQEAHITITTTASSVISTTYPLVLMDRILPNAVNTCTVKYWNGKAKLYVDDINTGYVITVTQGTDDGSAYYGFSRNLPTNYTTEYISFGEETDNKTTYVNSIIPVLHKPVSIVGNGKYVTDLSFNNGALGTDQSFSMRYLTVRDFTLTGGTIDIDRTRLSGTIHCTGGTIKFGTLNEVEGEVMSNFIFASGSTISGSGSLTIRDFIVPQGALTLDGITINGTIAQKSALRCEDAVTPLTITNCIIQGHMTTLSASYCGGALYVRAYGATSNITGTTICYNVATDTRSGQYGVGGGVYVTNSHTLNLVGCLIAGNTSAVNGWGGGICVGYSGTVNVSYCIIKANEAENGSNIAHGFTANTSATMTILNSTIADGIGGAGILSQFAGNLTIKGSTISGNTNISASGGGIRIQGSPSNGVSILLENCLISNNSAMLDSGAGIFLQTTVTTAYTISIKKCVFTGNKALFDGGGVYANNKTIVTLEDCIFSDNTPDAIGINDTATIKLKNCEILNDNITIASRVTGGSATIAIEGYFVFSNGYFRGTPNELITIASGSTINLTGNNYTDCILGSTITALGPFVVINKDGDRCDFFANSVTGSTITNTGYWLPGLRTRLVLAANTTASYRGYDLSYNNVNGNGGGVAVSGSNISAGLYGCTISGNTATYGAGICNATSGVHIDIYDSTISNNYITTARSGAVLYLINGATTSFNNCTITGNKQKTTILVDTAASRLDIKDSTISNNYITGSGEMLIRCQAGTVTISDTLITGNTTSGDIGPAGYNTTANALIVYERCVITQNKVINVSGYGGTLYNSSSARIIVKGSSIFNNTCNSGYGTIGGLNGGYQEFEDCYLQGNFQIRTITGSTICFKGEEMYFNGTVMGNTENLTFIISSGSTVNITGGNSSNAIVAANIIIHGGTDYDRPTAIIGIEYDAVYDDFREAYRTFVDLEIHGTTIARNGLIYGATIYSHDGDDHYCIYVDANGNEIEEIITNERTYVVPGGLAQVSLT